VAHADLIVVMHEGRIVETGTHASLLARRGTYHHLVAAAGGAAHPNARVTSVSSDLEPPLDFAVAEADIVDAGAARDVQIGTLGDVRAVAAR
jgi:ABC-type glutathione transport system ATPase component